MKNTTNCGYILFSLEHNIDDPVQFCGLQIFIHSFYSFRRSYVQLLAKKKLLSDEKSAN